MSTLSALFTATAIFSISFLIWTYTKSGKKWLKEL